MRRLIALVILPTGALPAQQLADRVASVQDGNATFSYAARPDVCGDGRVLLLPSLDPGSQMVVFSSGPGWGIATGSVDMGRQRCTRGPVRVQLSVRNRRIEQLQPSVGKAGAGRGRDLGTIGTSVAVDFLLDLATRAPKAVSSGALLAAALADSVTISPRLVTLAEDRRLHAMNRAAALQWLGWTAAREGNTAADAHIRAIAADETDDPDVRERAIEVVALPAGERFLEDLYPRLTLRDLKERVIRALGERPSPSSADWIERLARDRREPLELRERAIRVLGEDLHEIPRLRSLYADVRDPEVKDVVMRVVGEAGDADAIAWLKTVAADRGQPVVARDRALRALDEAGAPSAYFVSLYDTIGDPDLKLRLIKLLGERDDRAARAKLADIARHDTNPDLRRRAQRARQ
jgi:hypothetical protein